MTTPTEKLPTGYLQGLLSKTSPKPWEYQIVSTVIRDGLPLTEKYIHRICNEHGPLMAETGGWEMEGRDPDFELAALAPALAEEVIKLRGIIEDCEKSIAALTKAPAHPEYLETLQDYEDAPVGTVVKMLNGVSCLYIVKLGLPDDPRGWHMPGEPGCLSSGGLSGRRRRVLYWPEQEVVE